MPATQGVGPTGAALPGSQYIPELVGINNPLAITDDADRLSAAGVLGSFTDQSLSWPGTIDDPGWLGYRLDAQAHFNGNAEWDTSLNNGSGGFSMGITPTLNMLTVGDGTGWRQAWLGICDRSAVGLNTLNSSNAPVSMQLTNFRVQAGDLLWQGGEPAITTTFVGGLSSGIKLPWDMGIGSVDYPPIFQRYENYRKMSDDADPTRGATRLPSVLPSISSPTDYSQATLQPDTVYVTVSVPKYQPANILR